MIESKDIWLTELKKSNDCEELSRGYINLWERIKKKLSKMKISSEELDFTIDMIDKHLYLQEMCDQPFGCCFCEESDLMQQWNEYGGCGDGVALGFDLNWFPKLEKKFPTTTSIIENAIGYEKVMYDTRDDVLVDDFIDIIFQSIEMFGHEAWLKGVLSSFKHYAAFIKNPTFKDERETRIVFYPDKLQKEVFPGLHGPYNNVRLHYCLKWADNSSSALRSITIGRKCVFTEKEIRLRLRENGISNHILITESDCSFRERLP